MSIKKIEWDPPIMGTQTGYGTKCLAYVWHKIGTNKWNAELEPNGEMNAELFLLDHAFPTQAEAREWCETEAGKRGWV